MPKERLHILLAHQTFRLLRNSGVVDGTAREGYLLGAILPDIFFYDLPSFKLGNSVGREIHKYEGQAIVDFFGLWIDEEKVQPPQDMKHWMLGFASHLLADGMLHPHINGFCGRFSEDLGFTAKSCHHWLESELESHWLRASGPSDGYLPLLRQFEKRNETAAKHLEYVRQFLQRANVDNVPSYSRIRRCLNWQTLLLRLFANPAWAKIRPVLLKFAMTESLGVLLVPPRSNLCNPSVKVLRTQFEIELCEPDFMAKTVSYLATHLLELLKRF